MYGLTLIAVLAVMGGIIAYTGDKLGTKVGKKKLTIFGLRPKYTSIIITIITGILIAGSTLGVLALASRDVRTALFGMEALKAELATLSSEVKTKSKELEESRAALDAKTAEYSAVAARVKETAAQLAALSSELNTVVAERDRVSQALAKVQEQYSQARGDLNKAKTEIDALQKTKSELDARVAALNQSKTALQADVDRLNQLTENLRKGIQIVREGTLFLRAGEVVSTSVVQGGQNQQETARILSEIINRTNQSILVRLGISDKNAEALWITKSDFDQAVDLLSATPESIIVRISAAGNTIYGEPVIGQLNLFPNRLVYTSGAVVYSEIFDAGRTHQQAEEVVLVFLQKVNAQAVENGILPDPIRGTVGEMSGSQLFEIVNKVKRTGGKVELSATTQGDIYTVGPLKIDIKVRSVQ